jgi:cellulose synthase operon protein B
MKVRQWLVLCQAVLVAWAAGSAGAAESPTTRTVHLSLRDLGAQGPLELRGVAGYSELPIGARGDEIITQARLHLRYSYSPSMLPELSHLRISLNGEPAAALPLPRETAGHEITRDVDLDPQYFSDFNHLRLQLVGHYTHDCEDPGHTALWATISDRSELELQLRAVDLRNDLALLPAPFFDRRDSRPLILPVVLPAGASLDVLRSAGVVASWFGTLADYRQTQFPVMDAAAVTRHALVFATNQSKPSGLALADVSSPTVRVLDNPNVAHGKLLVFMGRDEAQLRTAVLGVALGATVLTGESAEVRAVTLRPRQAYDTPRWLRTDRPVRFSELVTSPEVLEVHGKMPEAIRLNLRLPPDLMTWQQTGLPIDLHYRYTAPTERDESSLTVEVNDRLARVIHLRPDNEADGVQRLMVPLVASTVLSDDQHLSLPGIQVGTDNRLSLRFAMDSHIQGACRERMPDVQRSSIDPDSTIDLTGFRHYVALPNLALFASAGYPFTRMADLSQTIVVLKDASDASLVESYLHLMGRFGRLTGVPVSGVRLVGATATAEALRDADLLVLASQTDVTQGEGASALGVTLRAGGRTLRQALEGGDGPAATVEVSAQGSVAAMEGYESPYSAHRSVVTLLANDAPARAALAQALETRTTAIHGDVVVVRGESLHAYRSGTTYYVGDLPMVSRAWYAVSRHPWAAIGTAVVLVSLLGFIGLGALRRRAARRLGQSDGE